MRKVLLSAAIAVAALTMATEAYSFPQPQQCVPTPSGNGRTILICGTPGHRASPGSQCRMVYNTYTRTFQRICR